MKIAASLLGLTAVAGTAMAGSGVGPDLLLNGSFEVLRSPLLGGGFEDWDGQFGNVFQVASGEGDPAAPTALDGGFTCQMYGGFFGPGVQSDQGVFQQVDIGPDAGDKTWRATISTQSLSADPLAPFTTDPSNAGHLPLLLMQFKDAAGNQISQPESNMFDASVDPFDTWLTKSVEGFAPIGTESVTVFPLLIQFGDDPGALYLDSAMLQEVEGAGPDCPDSSDFLVDDSTAEWEGFMNVSELPENGGDFVFGSGWGVGDLTTNFDDGVPSITMSAVEVNDPDPFWYVGGGMPGAAGNKQMEANLFQTITGCLAGETVTFSGFVHENTLAAGYEASIFIKDFAAGFGSFEEARIPATPGPFTLSLDAINDPTRAVQIGFTMVGANVWPGDAGPVGTVVYSSVASGPSGCNDADLAEPFGILDLSDITAFISAFTGQLPAGDINGDMIFDLTDITLFISEFTGGCP